MTTGTALSILSLVHLTLNVSGSKENRMVIVVEFHGESGYKSKGLHYGSLK